MNSPVPSHVPLMLLNQLVSILYLSTVYLYGAHFFSDHQKAKSLKQPFLIGTVVTHVIYLGLLTSIEGYKISYSTVNLMSMVGFTLTSIYLLTEFTTKSDKTGFFIISFAAGAQLISSLLSTQIQSDGMSFTGLGIGIHLITAIFGFSSIAIAGIYSILYLLLFRQIQQNRYELFFQRLPNLEILEQLTMHAVSLGFLFLTLTLIAGVLEQNSSGAAINLFEPKLITMVIIWFLYGTGITIKPIIGWDIKHMAYLFIFLFLFLTILIVFMTLFSPTFHGVR